MERSALFGSPLAGKNVHPRHGGNGRQRLAPKAQGADGGKILRTAELAGGVAQKGRGQLARRYAAAVIRDAQVGKSAVLHLHRHGGSAGVQGVFQQLLGHAGGTLHHLAGGKEVGDVGV